MTHPLFRQEAIDARQNRWLGDIELSQPVAGWVLALLAAGAAVAVICLLVFGDYTRRTRVSGELVPSLGVLSVAAPGGGTLAELRVEEGQAVAVGDVLAAITFPRATTNSGDTADEALGV